MSGEVAVVTGAASGIGKACVESLLARGAAVAWLDVDPRIGTLHERDDFLGLRCDVTGEDDVIAALESTVHAFGGLDILVLNAGVFPPSRRIEELGLPEWRRTMGVNLDANVVLMREAVFDTGIWTDEVLQERARQYGLSVDEYKRKNVLKVEVSSSDVAELVATLCGSAFAKTTGAQIPIDGGNDRVI